MTIVAVAAVAVVAIAYVFVHATGLSTQRASEWFTALGVIVAFLALMAAAAAATFAYPAYREWWMSRIHPGDVAIRIEAAPADRADDLSDVESVTTAHEVIGGTGGIYVRVAVTNEGRGVVRAGVLSVAVPADWQLRPDDEIHLAHYQAKGTVIDKYIGDGTDTRVRRTVVRDEFPPGIRRYHVQIGGPIRRGTQIRLLATLTGDGLDQPVRSAVTLVAQDSG